MNYRAGWVGGLALVLVVTAMTAGAGVAVGANDVSPANGGDANEMGASGIVANGTVANTVSEPSAAASTTSTQSGAEMVRTTSLSLTPEQPGDVGVVARYDVPEEIQELRVRIPETAESVTTDGFEETTEGYEWTGASDPAIRFDFPANRTLSGEVEPTTADGLAFVDVGPWAITRLPAFSSEWTRTSPVSFSSDTVVDGQGVVGDAMAYLGPYERHSQQANGQNFSLAVPEAASLTESPNAILDSLAAGSGNLRVGDRDERVLMIAAPTDAPWGPFGVQVGANAAWVRADERLDTAGNTWLHEYVHTRQSFRTTVETSWLTEASAQYYAALLALEDDLVGFRDFQRQLDRGDDERYDSVKLTEPGTWTRNAQYLKGSLVTGELDRRIRLATDGAGTFAEVFRRVNARTASDDRLTRTEFLSAVEDTEASVVDPTRRYTETTDRPSMWNRTQHHRAFGGATARFEYRLAGAEPFTIDGPYREGRLSAVPELVLGERLAVSVRVENTGTATGTYNATLGIGNRTVDAATGELAPGEHTNVTLAARFDRPGGPIRMGGMSLDASVSEPLEPTVTDVSADDVSDGTVSVTWRATNDGYRPANGTIAVTVDDELAEEYEVSLAPGGAERFRSTFELGPGTHRIGVGNRSITVTVPEPTTEREPTTTTAESDNSTPRATTESPGAGVGPVVSVLALLALAAFRRHGR